MDLVGRLPAFPEVVKITTRHHPNDELLRRKGILPTAEKLLSDVRSAAVAHHQIDWVANLLCQMRRFTGMLAIHELVDAGETVAEKNNGAVRIVLIKRAVRRDHLLADQRLRSIAGLLRLGQARMQIAIPGEARVLRTIDAPMPNELLVPGITPNSIRDELRGQLDATAR